MTPTKIHLIAGPATTLTACGRNLPPERTTHLPAKVTCHSCQPPDHRHRMRARQAEARAQPHDADSHFAGLGILKCHTCGRPIRDHPTFELCTK